jgi:hypothetical protein
MKKLTFTKAAIDFAFAHFQDGPVTLAIESATAFKALPGADEDFQIWQNIVNQNIMQAKMASAQRLPSEINAIQTGGVTTTVSPNVSAVAAK